MRGVRSVVQTDLNVACVEVGKRGEADLSPKLILSIILTTSCL